jgi:hypothetical protein
MTSESRSDSSGNTVLIVLGVIFGVILLVGLACVGLVYLTVRTVSNAAGGMMATMAQMMEDMQKADEAATGFLNDLAADRPDQAYAGTSPAFKQRQTLEQFKDFVGKNPALKRGAFGQHNPTQAQPGGRYTILVQLGNPPNPNNPGLPNNPGMSTCTIQVVKGEDGQWRVDALSAP